MSSELAGPEVGGYIDVGSTQLAAEAPSKNGKVRTTRRTNQSLLAERSEILARHRTTLDEFATRANLCHLVGEERIDWETLRDIAFLLGETVQD
jgi:hypothetical protein